MLEIDDEFKNRKGVSIQELLLNCADTGKVDLFLREW